MSSQDSKGESYVADYLADPKVYGEVEHYGWTTEEEEDYEPKGKEECRCQNRRISGRGSRTVRLGRMVTGGREHDVLPRFGPS